MNLYFNFIILLYHIVISLLSDSGLCMAMHIPRLAKGGSADSEEPQYPPLVKKVNFFIRKVHLFKPGTHLVY